MEELEYDHYKEVSREGRGRGGNEIIHMPLSCVI